MRNNQDVDDLRELLLVHGYNIKESHSWHWNRNVNNLSKQDFNFLYENIGKLEIPNWVVRYPTMYSLLYIQNDELRRRFDETPHQKLSPPQRELLMQALYRNMDTFIFTAYEDGVTFEVTQLLFKLAKRNHQAVRWFDYSKISSEIAINYLSSILAGEPDSKDLRVFYSNFPPSFHAVVKQLEEYGVKRDILINNNHNIHKFSDVLKLVTVCDIDLNTNEHLFNTPRNTAILDVIVNLSGIQQWTQSSNDFDSKLRSTWETFFPNDNFSDSYTEFRRMMRELKDSNTRYHSMLNIFPVFMYEPVRKNQLPLENIKLISLMLKDSPNTVAMIKTATKLLGCGIDLTMYLGLGMTYKDVVNVLYQLEKDLTKEDKALFKENCKSYKAFKLVCN